jgi:hypothetical protein
MSAGLKTLTTCLGYQQITSLSASTGLTIPSTSPMGLAIMPVLAVIIAENAAVRWRDDGVAPTAGIGMPLSAGTTFLYDGDLNRIRFIQQTAGAVINISYYV